MRLFYSFFLSCVSRCLRRRSGRLDLERALRGHHGRAAPGDRKRRGRDSGDHIVDVGTARGDRPKIISRSSASTGPTRSSRRA